MDGPEDSIWNIAYDLKSKKFLHLRTLADPPLYQIRLNKIPNPAAYFQHVAALKTLTSEIVSELEAEATQLFNIFKDYSLATVTLHDMPLEAVAPIFERINSTGTKLTIVDLMRAATWSESFDLVDTIDQDVLEVISAKGFGSIDRRAVLRVLSSASGFSFSTSGIDKLRGSIPEQLKTAAAKTVHAFKLTVDFLSDDLHIPNSDVIPYINQVVVIAEVFMRQAALTAAERSQLREWFWRTTLSNYFSGWNSGQMDTDREAVSKFINGETTSLDMGISKYHASTWSTKTFRSNNAHAKMLGLMLTQTHPRDLISGQNVKLSEALAWQNNKEYHHIFPKAYLSSKGYTSNRINALCNFALISSASNKQISDSKPSAYFSECANRLGQELKTVLESNLISEAACEAALRDDFEKFTIERTKTLNAYADTLCGW